MTLTHFTRRLFLVVSLLAITAHRLPAPIQEVPESPTPSPMPLAQPNPPSTTPERADAARFAGTWTGKIKIGNGGESDVTVVVNREATALTQILKRPTEVVHKTTHPATVGGHTLSWQGGQMDNVAWTLTLNPDDQTAVATAKLGAGVQNTAIFQRAQSSAEPTRKHPGAKVKPNSGD